MKSKKECKTEKKCKKGFSLTKGLRSQSDVRNEIDCADFIEDLRNAALEGEYVKVLELKVNQAHYLKNLGLNLSEVKEKFGFYQVSWEYDFIHNF